MKEHNQTCPNCFNAIRVTSEMAGRDCECPHCGGNVFIPDISESDNIEPPPIEELQARMESILKKQKLTKKINAAANLAIAFGAFRLVFIAWIIMTSIKLKEPIQIVRAGTMVKLGIFDIIYNIATASLVLYWGILIKRNPLFSQKIIEFLIITTIFMLVIDLIINKNLYTLWIIALFFFIRARIAIKQ